jgi:hypothetical protein
MTARTPSTHPAATIRPDYSEPGPLEIRHLIQRKSTPAVLRHNGNLDNSHGPITLTAMVSLQETASALLHWIMVVTTVFAGAPAYVCACASQHGNPLSVAVPVTAVECCCCRAAATPRANSMRGHNSSQTRKCCCTHHASAPMGSTSQQACGPGCTRTVVQADLLSSQNAGNSIDKSTARSLIPDALHNWHSTRLATVECDQFRCQDPPPLPPADLVIGFLHLLI